LKNYLRNSTVRQQLNIPETVESWDWCRNIPYTVNKTTSSLAVYQSLETKKWKVLKFSGNTDFEVSTYGTRQWVDDLALDIHTQWRQFFVKDQVGGYYEVLGSTG